MITTMIYGQKAGKYTISTEYENVEFAISADRIWYYSNDTITVNCLIKNLSNTPIFIHDYRYYKFTPHIHNLEIYFDYGDNFWGSLNLVNKLMTLNPSDSVSIDFHIQIEKDSSFFTKRYLIEVGIGTFRYDKTLEYLTKIEEKSTGVEDNDMYKLTTLYNSIFLGYLPIYIKNNSVN